MGFSVIKTGGKQYVVKPGQKLKIEKLIAKDGDKVKLETLLTAEEDGSEVKIGKPFLTGKTEAKVLATAKGKKVLVVKFRPKTRFKKRVGHRQMFTQIEIAK